MKVTLINSTPFPRETLIFTKSTRLNLSPSLFKEICGWSDKEKNAELAYMAETIPSSWEMIDYIFLMSGVSRAYTHQQVRTRWASYAQQSLRVLDAGDFDYVFTDKNLENKQAHEAIDDCLHVIKDTYRRLIGMGQQVEDARGILPTNIATNIVCKFNLRTLAELARSRTGGRTQSEYVAVVNATIDIVLAVHPWAERFLFGSVDRNYFTEIEAFAKEAFPDITERSKLLKIVDRMRKEI